MSRSDFLAIFFSIVAAIAAAWVSQATFDRLPHLEDEMAYVWQAQAIAGGHLILPSPPCPKCFLVPFVVDDQGQRFGKYPPAWPVVLAGGILLGQRYLVNALLAGLGVWLTYRLGKKVFNAGVGLLAALLTLTSPFFLMESASLLSHAWALFLSAAFALAWLDSFARDCRVPRWLTGLVAALSLGLLALTRPLTAVGVALPFAIHGVILLWRGSAAERRRVLWIGGLAGLVSLLLLLWQYAASGDPLLNLYTLWWPYDRIGFGPGVGFLPEGHSLKIAWMNLEFSLYVGDSDLFGWGRLSWIFLPFGLWAIRKNGRAALLGGVLPSLLVVYLLYWIGSWVYGPRYYYEGLYSVTLLSAAGIAWLAGYPITLRGVPTENPVDGKHSGILKVFFLPGQAKSLPYISKWPALPVWRTVRRIAVITLVSVLLAVNLVDYIPLRLAALQGFNNINPTYLQPFVTAPATPTLVIVHIRNNWVDYGRFLDLESPYLDTPYIFIYDRGAQQNKIAIEAFPDRKVFDYYP